MIILIISLIIGGCNSDLQEDNVSYLSFDTTGYKGIIDEFCLNMTDEKWRDYLYNEGKGRNAEEMNCLFMAKMRIEVMIEKIGNNVTDKEIEETYNNMLKTKGYGEAGK